MIYILLRLRESKNRNACQLQDKGNTSGALCGGEGHRRIQGGGGSRGPDPPFFYNGPPFFSNGIDFYSGSRKKLRGGGCNSKSLKNPGIYFYSGFRKTSQGGGGAILIPKKVGPP